MVKIPREVINFEFDYSEDLFNAINKFADKHKDIFNLYSIKDQRIMTVVNKPELIKYILQTNNKNYTKGLGMDKVKILLGNGIMVSEGNQWKKQRKIVQQAFHKEVLESIKDKIIHLNQTLIKKWEEYSKNNRKCKVNSVYFLSPSSGG